MKIVIGGAIRAVINCMLKKVNNSRVKLPMILHALSVLCVYEMALP